MNIELNQLKAAELYLTRKQGTAFPEGNRDNANRFYPAGRDAEVMADVREPTRAYPWSYFTACLSIKHCAAYFNTDAASVRKASKKGLLTVRKLIDQAEGRTQPSIAAPMEDDFDPSFFAPEPLSTFI